MCSKRCKHNLKDRIPTCGLERRCCERSPQVAAACMLQRTEDLVDCDKCKPASPVINEHICMCTPELQSGTQQVSQHETTAEPQSPQQQSSAEFGNVIQQMDYSNTEAAMVKNIRENKNKLDSKTDNSLHGSKTDHNNLDYSSYEKLPPTQIRHMDEWEAMAVMLATNGRVWGGEDKSFARQYKAALSAVNTKFEEEAANIGAHAEY